MKNFRKNHVSRLVVDLIFIFVKINTQTCGGMFGNPIFNETVGTLNTPNQTISTPLAAATSNQYVSTYPPNDGQYTISNQSGCAPLGWVSSADHSNIHPELMEICWL